MVVVKLAAILAAILHFRLAQGFSLAIRLIFIIEVLMMQNPQYKNVIILYPSRVAPWARILVQVTIYRRLLIGRDGHLNQSEAYDIS